MCIRDRATTIHFVYPVLVILGCVIFYREAISRLKVVCVVLCTAGILLLYTPGGGVSLLGIALSFLSGVTYAFYAVYLSKSGLQKMGAFQLMFWLNLLATAYIGLFTAVSGTFTIDIPVSYTHLDVYKRQTSSCISWRSRRSPAEVSTAVGT